MGFQYKKEHKKNKYTMIKKIILAWVCCLAVQISSAQELPKWAEKARKAVFSVVTYDKDNKILNTGNGFYIDETGTAVSDYTLFKGADHAVVVTTEGKELPVKYIMGANDMYDVVKFKTETEKKMTFLQPATQAASQGETVYLLPYSTQKSNKGEVGTVVKIDSIANQSFYYTLNMQTNDKNVSCPIMNAAGQVIGIIQRDADKENKQSYAIGVGYAAGLSVNALSGTDMTLNAIGIKKGLPEKESDALVYLYMMSSQLGRDAYLSLLNDFIAQFPTNMEGYQRRATCYMTFGDDEHNKLAEADVKKMFDTAQKKEEAHYNFAKLLYNYNLSLGEGKKPYADWTYDRALQEVDAALAIAKEGLYYQLQGDIYFAQKKYAEAATAYAAMNQTPMASAASYYSEAKAKEMAGGTDNAALIALLDSAVAKFNLPYGQDAAPYIYERAQLKDRAGEAREAVKDYNAFYDAMMGDVSAQFYVVREQAEMKCRMYQQGIDDINKAVDLDPNNVELWVEKGGVHLRVNQLDEAEKALTRAISIDAENAPAYRMLGYCQIQQKKKEAGLKNLQRAKDLGDEVAEGLIEKFK